MSFNGYHLGDIGVPMSCNNGQPQCHNKYKKTKKSYEKEKNKTSVY